MKFEMNGTSTGKRAANRERVRDDLAAAALSLFDRQGFADTTVDEIADAGGVSRRTLFRHFPTKADVIFADHPERIVRLEEYLLAASPDTSPLDVVIGSAKATIPSFVDPADFFLTRHRLLKDTLELRLREQAYGLRYTGVLAQFLRRRLRETGVDVADVNALSDMIASAVVTVVNRAQRTWSASGGHTDAMETTAIGLSMLRQAFDPLVNPRSASATGPTVIVMNADGSVPPDVVKRLSSIFDSR